MPGPTVLMIFFMLVVVEICRRFPWFCLIWEVFATFGKNSSQLIHLPSGLEFNVNDISLTYRKSSITNINVSVFCHFLMLFRWCLDAQKSFYFFSYVSLFVLFWFSEQNIISFSLKIPSYWESTSRHAFYAFKKHKTCLRVTAGNFLS